MADDFTKHWEKRVQSDDFKKNLNESVKTAVNEALDLKIGDVLDDLAAGIEQGDQKTANEIVAQVASALIINGTPIVRAQIEEQNMSLSERMGDKPLAAWREVVSQPVDLPPETVGAVLDQPAVKELFITLIHDAIIAFNKKFNPLAGALAALGIEKQIKQFLEPFMGNAIQIAKNFMTDNKNSAMFQDFAGKIFDIAVQEKPAKYMSMPIDDTSKLVAAAIDATLNDEKFQEVSKKSALDLIKAIKEKYASQTFRDYMKDNGINDPTRDLTPWELETAAKYLGKNAFTSFMANEVAAFSGG